MRVYYDPLLLWAEQRSARELAERSMLEDENRKLEWQIARIESEIDFMKQMLVKPKLMRRFSSCIKPKISA